jgi:uncharacterized membrane protein
MVKVKYTETKFNEPNKIDEGTYWLLKRELQKNRDFEIDNNPETFSEHFSEELKILKWGFGISIPVGLIMISLGDNRAYSSSPIFILLGVIITIGFFGSVLMLFAGRIGLEGGSYATYLNTRKNYFNRMKNSINESNSYADFCSNFYNK